MRGRLILIRRSILNTRIFEETHSSRQISHIFKSEHFCSVRKNNPNPQPTGRCPGIKMNCENWKVKPDDVRPARQDGTCFYCRVPLGGEHNKGCVIRTKTIVQDFTIRLVRRVPEDWDEHMADFHANDSSWCASNIVQDIQSIDTDARCLCDRTTGKFVREATKEDEERYGICERE